jgi:alpha-L-fucosidase
MHGTADFATAEVEFPKQRPAGWWEMCSIWNCGGWGYTSGERYRSTESVLGEFCRVRAWGGNYLINVGPRANGELPEIAYQRLAELSTWMQHCSSAVMDTQAGGWPEDSNVPYTVKDNLRYLLVPSQFKKTVEFRCGVRPQVVRLLRTGESINYRYANGDKVRMLSFELAQNQRCGLVDNVLVVLP